jgi:peptidoglycan L-alanyl-D-glutamate endopeptidase CwlK
MIFTLSKRSLDKLEGVDDRLQEVVREAIGITKVDFGVIEGVRSVARQKRLVNSGASQTMDSQHIHGRAVDLLAYSDGRASWELNLYDDIAQAIKESARINNLGIRWGGAWNIEDIRFWNGSMEKAMNYYIDSRRSVGKKPFIDGPHFEVIN